ncbi:hypothetical protein GCM10010496_53790 [Streptomyces asoensis]|nr:hypothetical protein GCM10010496_53790 [Streptomyces asoensis]
MGGEIRCGPGLVRQRMRVAEGLRVASRPPLQVAAGGEVVPGGVDLVGVAADVVVQVEVRVTRGDTRVLRWGVVRIRELDAFSMHSGVGVEERQLVGM